MTLPLAMIGPELALAGLVGLEDLRFPRQLAGLRVERVDWLSELVSMMVCRRSRCCGSCRRCAFAELALVLPEQSPVFGVEGLDVVAGVRQVHHAVVDERRGLLVARRPCACVQTMRSCATLRC